MPDLRHIDWGVGDAAQEVQQEGDRFFSKLFIDIEDSRTIDIKHHLFIWGDRGIGKSALAWKFRRDAKDQNFVLVDIDFEDAEHWLESVLSSLDELVFTNLPKDKLIKEIWYKAILLQIMKQFVNHSTLEDFPGKDTLSQYVRQFYPEDQSFILKIFYQISVSILEMLENVGAIPHTPLSIKALQNLENILFKNTTFEKAEKILYETAKLERAPHIYIIADSIDKYLPGYKDRNLADTFTNICKISRCMSKTLIKIYTKTRQAQIPEHKIKIKSFFPSDLEEHIKDRAIKQERAYHHTMKWSPEELKNLINKRISSSPHTFGTYKGEPWKAFFPNHITNSSTKANHDSFSYCLRHSRYCPREILMFCRRISEFAEKNQVTGISDEQFRAQLHDHCREEATAIIKDYEISYPNIYIILDKIRHKRQILNRSDLHSEYKNLAKDPNDIIKLLYDIGVLGIVLETRDADGIVDNLPYTPTKQKTLYFAFKHHNIALPISTQEKFCIHPIFFNKLDTVTDKEITICLKERIPA